jgi:hypothetical protein
MHGSARTDFPVGMTFTNGSLYSVGFWDGMASGFPPTMVNDPDALIARIELNGSITFFNTYASATAQLLSIRPSPGGLIAAGQLRGSVDLGGGVLTSQGSDGLLVEVDPNGVHRHSLAFGGAGDELLTDVQIDRDGSWVISGGTTGTLDLGGGMSAVSVGGFDGVIARIAPRW